MYKQKDIKKMTFNTSWRLTGYDTDSDDDEPIDFSKCRKTGLQERLMKATMSF